MKAVRISAGSGVDRLQDVPEPSPGPNEVLIQVRPVNEIATDPVRAELDQRLCRDVLGIQPDLVGSSGPLALLRQKLAAEPSIAGAKAATTSP